MDDERAPFERSRVRAREDPEWIAALVEACAVTQFRRHHDAFYIKGKGEIDLAVVRNGRVEAIEIKWTSQLRPKDLKTIAAHPNGRILNRAFRPGSILGVPTEPLPVALFRLG